MQNYKFTYDGSNEQARRYSVPYYSDEAPEDLRLQDFSCDIQNAKIDFETPYATFNDNDMDIDHPKKIYTPDEDLGCALQNYNTDPTIVPPEREITLIFKKSSKNISYQINKIAFKTQNPISGSVNVAKTLDGTTPVYDTSVGLFTEVTDFESLNISDEIYAIKIIIKNNYGKAIRFYRFDLGTSVTLDDSVIIEKSVEMNTDCIGQTAPYSVLKLKVLNNDLPTFNNNYPIYYSTFSNDGDEIIRKFYLYKFDKLQFENIEIELEANSLLSRYENQKTTGLYAETTDKSYSIGDILNYTIPKGTAVVTLCDIDEQTAYMNGFVKYGTTRREQLRQICASMGCMIDDTAIIRHYEDKKAVYENYIKIFDLDYVLNNTIGTPEGIFLNETNIISIKSNESQYINGIEFKVKNYKNITEKVASVTKESDLFNADLVANVPQTAVFDAPSDRLSIYKVTTDSSGKEIRTKLSSSYFVTQTRRYCVVKSPTKMTVVVTGYKTENEEKSTSKALADDIDEQDYSQVTIEGMTWRYNDNYLANKLMNYYSRRKRYNITFIAKDDFNVQLGQKVHLLGEIYFIQSAKTKFNGIWEVNLI